MSSDKKPLDFTLGGDSPRVIKGAAGVEKTAYPLDIPVRTDFLILGPDDPNKPRLAPGFVVKEYNGVEVSLAPPGLTAEEVIALEKLPEGFEFTPITDEDAIQPGSVLLSPGLVGGYHVGTVSEDRESFKSPGGSWCGFLKFGEDDRNCWVCWGGANLKAIQKLELER